MTISSGIRIRKYPWQWKGEYCISDDKSLLVNTICPMLELKKDICFVASSDKLYKSVSLDDYILVQLPISQEADYKLGFINKNTSEKRTIDLFFESRKFVEKEELDKSKKYVKHWLSFIDEIALLGEKSDINKVSYGNLPSFIEQTVGDENNPYYSIIVKISNDMKVTLPSIVHGLRKILKSQRQMMPLNRISELDPSCIRWIVKQPGKTIYEKASANRFRLLGITRKENYDLLENRVLKDFIFRCATECREYINNLSKSEGFKQTERYKLVRAFGQTCSEFLENPVFENVTRQVGMTMPNYVLQNDIRYKRMWKFYLRLLKKEKELDSVWRWQYRTFEDISQFLLQASLCNFFNKQHSFISEILVDSILKISSEQVLGSKLSPLSVPGPFYIDSVGKHVIVSMFRLTGDYLKVYGEYPYIQEMLHLIKLGTTTFIKIEEIGKKSSVVIPVYFLHTALLDSELDENYIKNLARDAHDNCSSYLSNFKLAPLIFCSCFDDVKQTRFSFTNIDIIVVNTLLNNLNSVFTKIAQIIERRISDLIGE